MKTQTRRALTLPLLVAVVMLSFPLASSANSHMNRDEDTREERKENKNEKHCLKGFGHLISKGFKKNKGEVKIEDFCFVPKGILKKLRLDHSTSSPFILDLKKPRISDISATSSTSTINVSWQTNENTTSRLYYSTSLTGLNLHATSTNFLDNSTLKTDHAFSLGSLTASTTYYLLIEAKDASGNRNLSPVFYSTTK